MANLMNTNLFEQGKTQGGLTLQMKQALDQIKPLLKMANGGTDYRGIEKEVMARYPQFGAFAQMMSGRNPDAVLNEMLRSQGVSMRDVMDYLKQ